MWIWQKCAELRLVHWLLIIAIVVVLVALLLPEARWASDGEITIPVVVTVFDAATFEPIEGARVAIIRGRYAEISDELEDSLGRISDGVQSLDETRNATDAKGKVVIETEFRTGANHEHSVTRAHTNFYWVLVTADGYGGVAVPVRYQSIESHVLREKGDLAVSIGLIRSDPVGKFTNWERAVTAVLRTNECHSQELRDELFGSIGSSTRADGVLRPCCMSSGRTGCCWPSSRSL